MSDAAGLKDDSCIGRWFVLRVELFPGVDACFLSNREVGAYSQPVLVYV